jgi:hypothetical protein
MIDIAIEKNLALTKEQVIDFIFQIEDIERYTSDGDHVISILTKITQLIARIDTDSLSDEQIMRVLNAIGYEERSWIDVVRKNMTINE